MSSGVCISWENLNSSVNLLNEKIKEIDRIYKEMDDLYKELDGTTNTWVGENQKKFYEAYSNLSSRFPKNIEKFKEYHTFLGNVRDSYRTSDSTVKASAEERTNDLMA